MIYEKLIILIWWFGTPETSMLKIYLIFSVEAMIHYLHCNIINVFTITCQIKVLISSKKKKILYVSRTVENVFGL